MRDWRSGELGILLLALVLAVSVVVGISSFVTRLQSALLSESARFLAADMVVISRTPVSADWSEHAQSLGLIISESMGFPSMAVADGERMSLVYQGSFRGIPTQGFVAVVHRALRRSQQRGAYSCAWGSLVGAPPLCIAGGAVGRIYYRR